MPHNDRRRLSVRTIFSAFLYDASMGCAAGLRALSAKTNRRGIAAARTGLATVSRPRQCRASIARAVRNRACICTGSGRPECTLDRTFAIAPGRYCHCPANACFEEATPGFPYLALASLGGRAGLPGDQGPVRGGPPPRRQGPDPPCRHGLLGPRARSGTLGTPSAPSSGRSGACPDQQAPSSRSVRRTATMLRKAGQTRRHSADRGSL